MGRLFEVRSDEIVGGGQVMKFWLADLETSSHFLQV